MYAIRSYYASASASACRTIGFSSSWIALRMSVSGGTSGCRSAGFLLFLPYRISVGRSAASTTVPCFFRVEIAFTNFSSSVITSYSIHYTKLYDTLGFGIIVYRIVLGTELVGAADGIYNVPAFPLLPGVAVSGKSSLRVMNYYVAWGFVILGMVFLMNLRNNFV